ncbi:MAG: peptidase [Altererythrobacter sp.]|nr:peptidase [Altererythrobacter sp.]MBK61947.1 peptidase [Altererythrobacter sp.]
MTAGRDEPVQPVRPAPPPAPTPLPAPTQPPVPQRAAFTYQGELEQGGWLRGRAPSEIVSATLGDTDLSLDDDGYFFAAFDRDQESTIRLSATRADGQVIAETLSIKPRDWNIERVNVARRAGGASESFMQRRRPELEAIWNARQEETGAEGWRQDFIWPVTGRISGRFGSQRIYRGEPGSYHSGLDIAGGSGTTYVAPADGIVVLSEPDFSLEGQLLIIDHGQGLNSAFLHSSELFVRDGQEVKQGQKLGRIGSSGRATGPHLHWSLVWRNKRLDPLLFLPPMP